MAYEISLFISYRLFNNKQMGANLEDLKTRLRQGDISRISIGLIIDLARTIGLYGLI